MASEAGKEDHAEDFWSPACVKSHTVTYRVEAAANKGKRWKPHKSMKSTWPVIYLFMGLASWLVWREGGFQKQSVALGRYFCLLLANLLCWPPIFFGGHSRRFAFLDCGGTQSTLIISYPLPLEAQEADSDVAVCRLLVI